MQLKKNEIVLVRTKQGAGLVIKNEKPLVLLVQAKRTETNAGEEKHF